MASTSASSVQKKFKYDVFLSFRGEDTRKNFVDHLYKALDDKGIITYKDDVRIEKGERIGDQLLRSIEESRIHIIVFSKNYASSSWCLDELVKIMECQKRPEHTAYPIFFDVEPTEVRKQSGAVGKAFSKHVTGSWSSVLFYCRVLLQHLYRCIGICSICIKTCVSDANEEEVGRWRNALKEAAGLAGMELKNTYNGHEATFIQKVVKDISLKLHSTSVRVNETLVGMETRVKKVVSSLELDSDDVRMIGIKGMGGAGKTTLARAVFDHICFWFDAKCFVENVREGSKGSGLKELQKQVLKNVSNDQSIDVTGVLDGKNKMKRMMGSRKVLLVLDDVDDIDQLEALAGEATWFKPGSRILITTRDKQVLVEHDVHDAYIYDVNLLSHVEAICLFSRYAFKTEVPIQGYELLSEEIVHYAAGLPLTIKVLGSFLRGKTETEWVDALERLKTIPLEKPLKVLEISYDGLEDDHKEMFLDVACLLKGVEKDKAIRILESCGLHAQIGLKVLEQKSLISVLDYGKLDLHDRIEEMGWNIVRRPHPCEPERHSRGKLDLHDRIEEMGWNIVRRPHPCEPERHSRLWIKEEIEYILVKELGTEATLGIKLTNTYLHPTIIMKGLRKMKKLRFLYISCRYRKDFDEVDKYLPNALQYLHWYRYPFLCLPETFEANKLVTLEMESSDISQLWERGDGKVLNNLRFLNLSYSKLKTFDLGVTPHLEKFDARQCDDFVELYMLAECPKLKSLYLSGSKLSNLYMGLTPQLETLDLGSCNDLVELHMPVECPKLKSLVLSGSKLRTFDLGLTPKLETLDLGSCNDLVKLHIPVECPKLKSLVLCGSRLSNLSVGLTPQLETLNLRGCNDLAELQMPFDCPKLKFLDLSGSKVCNLNLQLTPHLETLYLQGCNNLHEFHAPLGSLKMLVHFNIGHGFYYVDSMVKEWLRGVASVESLQVTTAESLTICPLHPNNNFPKFWFKGLYSLSSSSVKIFSFGTCACTSPESFSATICGLQDLKKLGLQGSITEVPKDLYKLECLRELSLLLKEIKHLPDSICKLKHLKSLNLCSCLLLEQLPSELGRLECLENLILMDCVQLRDIPDSICKIKSLKYLDITHCILVEKLPEELGRLESLEAICIEGASIKHLPRSLFQLKRLYIVGSKRQLESYGFTSLRYYSRYAAYCYIRDSQQEPPL